MTSAKNVAIFTGGEGPSLSDCQNFFLRHKPDFVIAADSGLERCLEYKKEALEKNIPLDFSPRLILGDFDSISDGALLNGFAKDVIERHSSYKDFTDTEIALSRARELFPGSFITLLGGSGTARADHFIGIYGLFGTRLSPDAWLCERQAFYNAAPSFLKRIDFSIGNLEKGGMVSIARAQGFGKGGSYSSSGLEWESGLFRKSGMPSISNRISGEYLKEGRPVQISFRRGRFVLIVPLSADVRIQCSG